MRPNVSRYATFFCFSSWVLEYEIETKLQVELLTLKLVFPLLHDKEKIIGCWVESYIQGSSRKNFVPDTFVVVITDYQIFS